MSQQIFESRKADKKILHKSYYRIFVTFLEVKFGFARIFRRVWKTKSTDADRLDLRHLAHSFPSFRSGVERKNRKINNLFDKSVLWIESNMRIEMNLKSMDGLSYQTKC